MNAKAKEAKKIIGRVISDKMDKTCVVIVERVKQNKLYKKNYTVSKKYKVHDEKNEFIEGDVLEISSSKPVSGQKRHIAVRKVVK